MKNGVFIKLIESAERTNSLRLLQIFLGDYHLDNPELGENLHPTELSLLVDTVLMILNRALMLGEFTNAHRGYRNDEMFRRMY